jgi:uncharacterized protein YbjQ (UPF0145 family)
LAEWDGHGLPPAAAERMARFGRHPVATSLLDVPDAVALASVGLTPVGEVMGCIVQHIGWQGYGGCGLYGGGFGVGPPMGWPMGGFSGPGVGAGYGTGGVSGYGLRSRPTRTLTSGQGGFAGYAPYVDALNRGFGTALARMGAEAQAMAADGVVGVRIVETSMGQDNREFMALGTAVRADCPTRPGRPFVTDASGADVARLVQAGWIPVDIAIGLSVAVRHNDYATRMQASSWASPNVEVGGYTELVEFVRSDARERFEAAAAADGADAATVTKMTLSIEQIEPGERHIDHVAECRVLGTSIARFHAGQHAISSTRTVLGLRRAGTDEGQLR